MPSLKRYVSLPADVWDSIDSNLDDRTRSKWIHRAVNAVLGGQVKVVAPVAPVAQPQVKVSPSAPAFDTRKLTGDCKTQVVQWLSEGMTVEAIVQLIYEHADAAQKGDQELDNDPNERPDQE